MNIVRILCKEMAGIFDEIGKLPDDVEPDDDIDVVMHNIQHDMNLVKESIGWLAKKYGETDNTRED